MKGKGAAPPDPGIKRFEKAVELIQDSDLNAGRSALYELVRTFPESSRVAESKRIIGEMNMDMLFDSELNPLKKDYIVQPGDSLNLIARKQQTTVECVMRANGLQSGTLQPGDHLFVFPLDFSLVVDVSGKTVTLLRNDRFFREYIALDVKLTPPKAPYEAKVSDKPAWVNGQTRRHLELRLHEFGQVDHHREEGQIQLQHPRPAESEVRRHHQPRARQGEGEGFRPRSRKKARPSPAPPWTRTKSTPPPALPPAASSSRRRTSRNSSPSSAPAPS